MQHYFSSITGVLRSMADHDEANKAIIFAAWEFAAGKLVADRTRVADLTDGRLTVLVPDESWKMHLSDIAPQIMARLYDFVPNGTVNYLDFRIDETISVKKSDLTALTIDHDISLLPESVIVASKRIEDVQLRESFLDAAARTLLK